MTKKVNSQVNGWEQAQAQVQECTKTI